MGIAVYPCFIHNMDTSTGFMLALSKVITFSRFTEGLAIRDVASSTSQIVATVLNSNSGTDTAQEDMTFGSHA